jgi:hypothetical protein
MWISKMRVITAGPTLREIVIRTPTDPRPMTVVPASAKIKIASALVTLTPIADACSGSNEVASSIGWAQIINATIPIAVSAIAAISSMVADSGFPKR